jgi:uncharacterized protein (TIGR02145 family)
MKSRFSLMIISILTLTINGYSQSSNVFTDSRDGQNYNTITIEDPLKGTSVTWMAHNLNFKLAEDCWAYNNDESNRKDLGLLYTWYAANKACPDGWHLPSDEEWDALINEFGGKDNAGKSLKSAIGWNKNSNGSNSSGFNGFPGGYRSYDGTFYVVGFNGLWWSSTVADANLAWYRVLDYGFASVSHFSYVKQYGFSVRCVRD